MKKLNVALVGLNGYGFVYADALLESKRDDVRLVAGVDPAAAGPKTADRFREREIPIFATMEEMYQQVTADLVVISSPIQFHCAQTLLALRNGSHVLCEKPVAGTYEEAMEMDRAQRRSGNIVAIGYQWSFCPVIHAVKADILNGRFGQPKRFRTVVLWPRDERYYARNRWAGRLHDPAGRPVFDSPANNACAHYLHNMLYLLGSSIYDSASIGTVQAELYRANAIESFDTAAVRCFTTTGVEVQFIASHATEQSNGPILSYEFENATITFRDRTGESIRATFSDGTTIDYGTPVSADDPAKLWATIDCIRTSSPIPCSVRAAMPHARAIAAMHESSPIINFPKVQLYTIGQAGAQLSCCKGLSETLLACHLGGHLPSEIGTDWAHAGKPIVVDPTPAKPVQLPPTRKQEKLPA